MVKIRAIKFHASYNYGSCLQAYALQEYIRKLYSNKCDYKIINLRTNVQKNMYINYFEKKDIKSLIKQKIFYKQKQYIMKKEELFENFISNYLNVTKEFESYTELKKYHWDADYYIAGSDQLWNLNAKDFNWAYFLDFVDNGKKISYAASFGYDKQSWNISETERVKNALKKFSYISIREKESFDLVQKLLNKDPQMNIDPTLLYDDSFWSKLSGKKPLVSGDYIFLYNLKGKKYIKLAKQISKALKMPIVVSQYSNKYELLYGFKFKCDVGPLEFLNLINNAKLVLSSSYHGTIFSILMKKAFYALDGNKDFRIQTLLNKLNLENRSIDLEDYKSKIQNAFAIDFTETEKILDAERSKSEKYLKCALNMSK